MKVGIIDVGGGLRGIYAAGVLDYCMKHQLHFDLGIGVSAGSANLISFIANQKGRNLKFYGEYAFRKEYMSLKNFIQKKSFADLDYIYSTLSNSDGEYPLDYLSYQANPMDFVVVATNAKTGKPKYFCKDDVKQDNYDIMKASSAIPFVCPPYSIDGVEYFDGALSDPIPIKKAFELGCDKVILILTKPRDVIRRAQKDQLVAKGIIRKYPKAAYKLQMRANTYNQGVVLAKQYEREGKVLIIAPDDTCGVDTLKKNQQSLIRLYKKGYRDAREIKSFIK